MEKKRPKYAQEISAIKLEMERSDFIEFSDFCNFVLAYEGEDCNGGPGTTTSLPLPSSFRQQDGSKSDTHTDEEEDVISDTGGRQEKGEDTAGADNNHNKNEEEEEEEEDGSSSSSKDSDSSSSASSSDNDDTILVYTSDDESWNLVTCYCNRPFAGRPMIECSKCLTWIHLSCANIKKNSVPDIFNCRRCRKVETVRRSKRRKH